jgi:beta-lactamase class A
MSEAVRSVGEGSDMQDGATIDVAAAAGLMISQSNNQTTDLLIHKIGRGLHCSKKLSVVFYLLEIIGFVEAVERVQKRFVSTHGSLPCLTTREFFVLKQQLSSDLTRAWLEAADADQRRALLPRIAQTPIDSRQLTSAMSAPCEPRRIEWLAAPLDVARLLASMYAAASRHTTQLAPLRAALTQHAGVPPDDAARWSTIVYKGGSEPGVLSAAWLCERDDGSRVVCVGGVCNERRHFDGVQVALTLAVLRDSMFANRSAPKQKRQSSKATTIDKSKSKSKS